LLLTLLDTGVPVWAYDSGALDGPLGLRVSRPSEPLGSAAADGVRLEGGQLVVADAGCAVALLFGALASSHVASAGCADVTLLAVRVPGVPWVHVEEALWMAATMLGSKEW
jgi:DNA/RNA-binding domain of Phe-tRNA-synthetase-like protein